MNKILSTIILLCLCHIAMGINSHPRFKHITISDGLSSGNVNCILQDSKGFIWIGTEEGLNKFDGYQITTYRYIFGNANSIGGNSVRCIFEDSNNNLWIGLKGDGLCRFNLNTEVFTTFLHDPNNPNSLSYNDVSGVTEDENGQIWVAVDRGTLDRFDPHTEHFHHYPLIDASSQNALNNAITHMDIDDYGHIWLSSWGGGIYRFDINTKSFRDWSGEGDIGEDRFCKHIFSILYDRDQDKLLISSAHGGVYILDVRSENPENKIAVSKLLDISLNTMASIMVDRDRIWIGGNIYIVDLKSLEVKYILKADGDKTSLLSNTTRCMYKDRQGTIWIGHDVGVSYYNKVFNQFAFIPTYNVTTKDEDKNVLSLMQDRTGKIWAGGNVTLKRISEKGKLEKNYTLLNTEHTDYSSTNQALLEDSKGNIWIGGYSNIITKYNPYSDKFSYIKLASDDNKKLPFGNVYSFYEDFDKSLWICTETGTVNYNPDTEIFSPLFQSERIIYPEDKSHTLIRDSQGELWIGTEGGLKRYSPKGEYMGIYTTSKNGLTNKHITSLIEDHNANLWVGTCGGLHYMDRKSGIFKLIKQSEDPYGDVILNLVKDNDGNIWMCTPSKIMMYDYQSDKFITYDESDGLQNGSFHKAFWVPHNGKLLIGGSDGINMFYPKQLSTESTIYPIILTDFQIFNRSIAPSPDGILKNVISQTKKITLKESQSVITFAFSAPDVISPNKIKYRYMMEGFDRDWTYTNYDRRSATYTNLAPGEYIFRVMASNRNGVWEENETSIAIEILPPLWKTNAAYFIYFLIIIAVIFLIIRYMVIRERDRHSIRMARLEAKQAIEMETLRTNLFTDISHEFRTPLTLIIGPLSRIIESGRYMKEDAQNFGLIHRNAKRLQRLINQFLDFRKIEQGEMRLNFKYGEIVGFVREVVDTFSFMASEKNIEYSFVSSIEELRMHFDPDKIEKILYNLISNALKYTPENGKVTINLSCVVNYNKHTLSIAVSDTGIGISEEGKKNLFSLFYRDSRSSTIHADGFGVGLSMTKTLVELHGGTISVESEQGCGSQFNVILPIDSDEQQTDLKEDEYLVQSELTPFKLPKDGMTSSDLPAESLETVLIVEDNNDMRIYIKSILPSHYTIHEAKDGYEGYNLATEIIPDIIISDIMMPVMDGMKMVELLRSNEKSNHIPIIFLTARHTEGQIVEGLSLGAEDYVTKPFSAEILRARIKNILNNRRKLWETYNRTDSISELGKQITDSPAKIEFIEKLNKVISLHMSDISFGVDILASELNMSVDQLSRKLRAFTNDTPYNIIFKARMQYAIELMKDGRKNITEITYEVGYKEVSNFSRAFKKHFGLSPKEYINSLQ